MIYPPEIEHLLTPPGISNANPWGIRRYVDPPLLNPRWQNDIVRIIETECTPISPSTHLVEEDYLSPHGGLLLTDDQVRALNKAFTPIPAGRGFYKLPYDTVIWSDLKKSGKTALLGFLFYAWMRIYGGECYSMANGKDQSRERAFNRVGLLLSHIQREDPNRYDSIVTRQDMEWIETQNPYASLQPVPVSPGTQAGAFQSCTGWDELWNYVRESAERLFAEMQPIPTIPNVVLGEGSLTPGTVLSPSVRLIATYVGYYGQAPLLWQLYEDTVNEDPETNEGTGKRVEGLEDLPCYESVDSRIFAYWNQDTPRMPWQTPEFIEMAKNDPINRLRPEEFRRLWLNRWTTGTESFIDIAKVKILMQKATERGLYNLFP